MSVTPLQVSAALLPCRPLLCRVGHSFASVGHSFAVSATPLLEFCYASKTIRIPSTLFLKFLTDFDTVPYWYFYLLIPVLYCIYKCLGETGPEEYLLESGAALSTSQRWPGHRPLGQGKQEQGWRSGSALI